MASQQRNFPPPEWVILGHSISVVAHNTSQLWAIMLRNSTETFINQSTSRKFLDTLEDILVSPRTSPVVRERIMDVVAAAAYASGSSKSLATILPMPIDSLYP